MKSTAAFSADDYRRLLGLRLGALDGCAVVVLSDYAKGALSEEVCQAVISEARAQTNSRYWSIPKNQSFARYRGATAICPNRKELAAATGEPAPILMRCLRLGQALLVSHLSGVHGRDAWAKRELPFCSGIRDSTRPPSCKQVFDVSGAGDTVIAVLALAMACGVPIETAVASR